MKKNKIKYLLFTLIFSFTFLINANAVTVNVEGKPGHDTPFGYKTQTQTISDTVNCNGEGNSEIYCVDKGLSNVKNFSSCTITDLNGTPFETIAFSGASHDEKEFAFRMLAKKWYPSLMKSSFVYDESKISALPAGVQGVVLNGGAGGVSKSIQQAKGNLSYKVLSNDGSTATVEITLKLANANLSNDKFYAKKGSIQNVKNAGNGTYYITASAPVKECKGADIEIKVKGGVVSQNGSAATANQTGVFHANCSNGQNYIIVTKGQCTIEELTQDSQDGISYKVNVPDENCNCDLELNDVAKQFNCKGDENNQTATMNETSKVKQCITSGSGALEKCDSSILKMSNDYCKVYCKEDIELNFPGKVSSKSGTYFTLKEPFTKLSDASPLKISGKRICYAGKPDNAESGDSIDKKKYTRRIIEYQEKAVKKYNEYLEIKAYMEAIKNASGNAQKTTCDATCPDTSRTCTDAEKKAGKTSCTNPGAKLSKEYTHYEGKATYTKKKVSWISYDNGTARAADGGTETVEVWYGEKASAGTCSGTTATCPDPVKLEKSELEAKYNEAKAQAALKEAQQQIKNIEKEVKKYKECFDWVNTYCAFDPQLYFTYDEIYNDQVQGYLGQKELQTDIDDENCFYTSTDDSYNGACASKLETPQTYISVEGSSISTMEKVLDIDHVYAKKSKKAYKVFNPKGTTQVCTYHPEGTVVFGNNCDSNKNYVKLGDDGYVFPVALEHRNAKAVYNYDLKVENIGAPGNDSICTPTDRIIGDTCSEYTVTTGGKEGKYVCQYSVGNCPECKIECECPPEDKNCTVKDGICYWSTDEDKKCKECVIECVGCLWNDGDTTISYKPISLNDVFPNDETTKVGYNWNTSSEVYHDQKQEVIDNSKKAEQTIKDIEQDGAGETIYEKKKQYSYVLDPSVMGKIREYNKENSNKGGYSNSTLKCQSVGTTSTGSKYATECKSEFLDESYIKSAQKKRNTKWETFEDNGTAWK